MSNKSFFIGSNGKLIRKRSPTSRNSVFLRRMFITLYGSVRQGRMAVYTASGEKCWLCSAPLAFEDMTIDHVKPVNDGGKNELSNLRASHQKCNVSRTLNRGRERNSLARAKQQKKRKRNG